MFIGRCQHRRRRPPRPAGLAADKPAATVCGSLLAARSSGGQMSCLLAAWPPWAISISRPAGQWCDDGGGEAVGGKATRLRLSARLSCYLPSNLLHAEPGAGKAAKSHHRHFAAPQPIRNR